MPVTGDITLEAKWLELVDAAGIELDQTKLTLGVGKKAKLIVTIKPENAKDKSVVWSSSNTNVVTVDEFPFPNNNEFEFDCILV